MDRRQILGGVAVLGAGMLARPAFASKPMSYNMLVLPGTTAGLDDIRRTIVDHASGSDSKGFKAAVTLADAFADPDTYAVYMATVNDQTVIIGEYWAHSSLDCLLEQEMFANRQYFNIPAFWIFMLDHDYQPGQQSWKCDFGRVVGYETVRRIHFDLRKWRLTRLQILPEERAVLSRLSVQLGEPDLVAYWEREVAGLRSIDDNSPHGPARPEHHARVERVARLLVEGLLNDTLGVDIRSTAFLSTPAYPVDR